MLVSDFHFDLPDDLIAQQPPAVRGSSRMLQLNRATGNYADRQFINLPQILQSGDLLVLNDSRVLPARLFATRAGLTTQHNSPSPSGHIEVLLTQACVSPEGHNDWSALVRPAKKVQPGEVLLFAAADAPGVPVLRAKVLTAGEFGERTVRFEPVANFYAALERIGYLPLPPYIHRPKSEPNTPEDRERYQTVYSRQVGSAAAPTAGLHFTPETLAALAKRGVEIARITLHVGLGTFQPVRVGRTEDIRLHAEPYTLSEATASAINGTQREGRRIIAVGTTTTRTLEHIARESERMGEPIAAHSGSTNLFLSPGVEFKLVSGLLTNFHLPQSTLLMLVSAFAGREAVLRAYAHAVAERYRFFSYGDCMLIL
ncbi:MAG TPA: tRNA preQ1(34) S-adenosylmethionine ribosyltransferase-isomerase QueA [Acidobacteriaceae bacterium]